MRFFSALSLLSLTLVAAEEGTLQLTRKLSVTALATNGATTKLGHYGHPPDDCQADEKAFQIQGIPGGICAAKCTDFLPCPTDLPAGATAEPQCALQDQTGLHYCVLLCEATEDAGSLRGSVGDAQCGAGATCQPVPNQGVGICTYL